MRHPLHAMQYIKRLLLQENDLRTKAIQQETKELPDELYNNYTFNPKTIDAYNIEYNICYTSILIDNIMKKVLKIYNIIASRRQAPNCNQQK